MPTFYGAVDLIKNELRNAVVQNLGSAPSSPVSGQIYFDSTAKILYWYNGTVWVSSSGATASSSVTTLAIGGAAVPGSAGTFSQGDHAHGMPAFAAPTAETAFGTGSAVGSAVTLPRSDHAHGNPTHDATAHSGLLGVVTPETTFGSASANGSATTISRADHAHGNPTHVAGDHSTIPLSAFAVPTTSINLNNQKIINLLDPTNPQDAATKNYVDNAIAGLSWKAPARAASTANIAALTGTMTVDGVALNAGDRILLKNQTTQTQNGVYVVAAGAWARSTDADAANELLNMAIYIEEGTTQADTGWVCTNNAPIVVGTTNLTFVQFTGAGTYSAGNGLSLSGNVFAVVAADSTITVSGSGVQVNTGVIATQAFVTAAITGMTKKFAAALVGTASPETVTHNLNTRDIDVSVINGASPWNAVQVDWQAATVNTVSIIYNPALGAGYRVVVIG